MSVRITARLAAVGLLLLASACTSSDDTPVAGQPTATQAASATPEADEAGCDEATLVSADSIRLDVYRAAMRHILQKDRALPGAYLTDHPVRGRGAASARQTTYSPPLLACLTASSDDLPALTAVSGFDDSQVVKERTGGGLARLTKGRLIELSGLDEAQLGKRVVVFVSLNGGGGFDYIDQTVQVGLDAAGSWRVTKVLGGAVA